MVRTYKGVTPTVAPSAYVDVSAQVIGDVPIGEESTNIQDGTVVHVMRDPSHPTILGDDITVGHGAIVHGCTIESTCLIGMGTILLNGVHVGTGSIIAAGTLLPEGAVVPPRSLVMGSPGKVRRSISDLEYEFIVQSAQNYVHYRLDYS
jgi:carbonic anhydrase/acetyltransferase-like protein (isoleucine patch superfamily)